MNYSIVSELGKGGHGIVYLAIDNRNGEKVALKQVNMVNPNILSELQVATTIVGSNCSPYVICYKESFAENGKAYIAMDYIEGPTVMEYTQPLRILAMTETLVLAARNLTLAMLYGLKFIHSQGIIHNDIKPSNIVVGSNRIPILVDFGISCNSLPQYSQCCLKNNGTSIYLPPEALQVYRCDKSDLWSLGSTIYSIVNGTNMWGLDQSNPDLTKQVLTKLKNKVQPFKLNTSNLLLNEVINNFLIYDINSRMGVDQAISILN